MSIDRWLDKNTHSLSGKTVAISGATGGIGRELCRHLTRLEASLILLDRNMERSHALADSLRADFPTAEISHIRVDMEDISSVTAAADSLLDMPVDYLILNAGAYSIPRHKCTTGYDNVFQINFISPYYLAARLLPSIKARNGKVIAVGSIAHRYSKTDENDVDFSTRHKASLVYGNAKRHLMFSLPQLSDDGSVVIAHPGITFTNITAHYPRLIFALIKHPMKIIFMSPRKAGLCILQGIFQNHGDREWIGPGIFDVWGYPCVKKLRSIDNSEIIRIRQTATKIYNDITNIH